MVGLDVGNNRDHRLQVQEGGIALIGFGIAFWDFQQQTELKGAAVSDGGDFEDGI